MSENLPGMEEFLTDQFKAFGETEVFSSLNDDGLISGTVYFWEDGVKRRADFVMVGHLVGIGDATDSFDTDNYKVIRDEIYNFGI